METNKRELLQWLWMPVGLCMVVGLFWIAGNMDLASSSTQAAVPKRPTAVSQSAAEVKNVKVVWVPYTDGTHLNVRLDLTNRSNRTRSWIVTTTTVDSQGRIRDSVDYDSAMIPSGGTQAVRFTYRVGYDYPPENWTFRISLSTAGSNGEYIASGPLKADYSL